MDKINSVLVLGDSLSKGVIYDESKQRYCFSANCFANKLQQFLRAKIVNTAKFGTTVSYGEKMLEQNLPSVDPDVVFIEFGGNDCDFDWNSIAKDPDFDYQPKTKLVDFEQTLRSIVSKLRQIGKLPLFMNLPPLNAPNYFQWFTQGDKQKGLQILKWLGDVGKIYWWHERYSAAIERVARDTSASCIDIRGDFLAKEDYREYLCRDGIHPNEKGHSLITQSILSFVKQKAGYLLVPQGI